MSPKFKHYVYYPLFLIVTTVVLASAASFNIKYKLQQSYITQNIKLAQQTGLPKPTVRIAIINSYSSTHPCTVPQVDGFVDFLAQYSKIFNFDIRALYMETKTHNTTPSLMDRAAQEAFRFIKNFNPDIVYTTDDNAARLVGIPASLTHIVIASGINRPAYSYIHDYHLTPNKHHIIFVQEQIRLDNFFQLIQQNYIFIDKAYILIEPDNMMTITGYYMLQNYLNEIRGKIPRYEVIRIASTADLRAFLQKLNKNDEQNVLLIIAAQRVYNDKGKLVPKTAYMPILRKYNHHFLELGGNPQFCRVGLAICDAPSFDSMGQISGAITVDFLLKKYYHLDTQVPKFVTWTNGVTTLAVNEKRLRKLGYYSILNHASLINRIY